MHRISRNSAVVTGMTDKRERRTSCIFFNRGFFLISPSVTGRRNRSRHPRDTDNRFVLAAVIKKDLFSLLHPAQIISR